MKQLAIALVHYPVLGRGGETITTAITNLDLHDMARSARTYGLDSFYVVHPVAAQRELALRIKRHWVKGTGSERIPTRSEALELLQIVPSIEDVYLALGGRNRVTVLATSAQLGSRPPLSWSEARDRIDGSSESVLILFGTGWGLAPALMSAADDVLPPLRGAASSPYNHLSVRAACAIMLDRLRGHLESPHPGGGGGSP